MKRNKIINDVIMVTYEFGSPIYITPIKDIFSGISITENRDEANKWNSTYDATKLKYHRQVTGYSKLTFEKI